MKNNVCYIRLKAGYSPLPKWVPWPHKAYLNSVTEKWVIKHGKDMGTKRVTSCHCRARSGAEEVTMLTHHVCTSQLRKMVEKEGECSGSERTCNLDNFCCGDTNSSIGSWTLIMEGVKYLLGGVHNCTSNERGHFTIFINSLEDFVLELIVPQENRLNCEWFKVVRILFWQNPV